MSETTNEGPLMPSSTGQVDELSPACQTEPHPPTEATKKKDPRAVHAQGTRTTRAQANDTAQMCTAKDAVREQNDTAARCAQSGKPTEPPNMATSHEQAAGDKIDERTQTANDEQH
ncbi:hypothetical protein BU15DRAFT_66619 [Melanogaster broomeanus]|nr:hypothetical protein BU15DRAFT_66619 [Melanogaster broomeanus]